MLTSLDESQGAEHVDSYFHQPPTWSSGLLDYSIIGYNQFLTVPPPKKKREGKEGGERTNGTAGLIIRQSVMATSGSRFEMS